MQCVPSTHPYKLVGWGSLMSSIPPCYLPEVLKNYTNYCVLFWISLLWVRLGIITHILVLIVWHLALQNITLNQINFIFRSEISCLPITDMVNLKRQQNEWLCNCKYNSNILEKTFQIFSFPLVEDSTCERVAVIFLLFISKISLYYI